MSVPLGIVPRLIGDLDSIDWSSTGHASGSAALESTAYADSAAPRHERADAFVS
ncbi:hypothetical protein [Streptomyces sp. NPDC052015]|uniref:hypothetical protein n=1 Tax=Streptomyces sp. NPDC052015 TaxID=3154755 RepID=UPI00342DD98F